MEKSSNVNQVEDTSNANQVEEIISTPALPTATPLSPTLNPQRSYEETKALRDSFVAMKKEVIEEFEMQQGMDMKKIEEVAAKNNDADERQHCFHCNKEIEEENIKKCSKCKFAYYCSQQCQKDNWIDEHKLQCTYVLPMLDTSNSFDNMFRIVWKSKTWGLKMVATKNISKGQFFCSEKPLIYVSNLPRHAVKKSHDDIKRLISSTLIEDKNNNNKEKNQQQTVFLYDDPFFGHDFPCQSMRSRVAFIILRGYYPMLHSHLFQVGLLGEDKEGEEITQLFKFIIGKKLMEIQESDVMWAYTMARQCDILFMDNFKNRSVLGECFSPVLACMNHSCNANAMSIFSRGQFLLFATRDIKAGEQIFRDYHNNNSDVLYWDIRRRLLQSVFSFVCKCSRCEQEKADPKVSKLPSFPERVDPASPEAKILKSPYIDANIPPEILSRLQILTSRPKDQLQESFRDVVCLIDEDSMFQNYLFRHDWSLLYSLLNDTIIHEIVENADKSWTANEYAIIHGEGKKNLRQVYLSVVCKFIDYIESNEQEISKSKSTLKRLSILYWINFCLVVHPYLEKLIDAFDGLKSNEKATNKTKPVLWYLMGFSEIVSEQDHMTLLASASFFSKKFLHQQAQIDENNNTPIWRSLWRSFFEMDIISSGSKFELYITTMELLVQAQRHINAFQETQQQE